MRPRLALISLAIITYEVSKLNNAIFNFIDGP
jgi:hypothetical protein